MRVARETETKQTWLCCVWDESVYWPLGRSRRREGGGWPRWEAQGEGALQSSLDQIFLWQAAPAIAMRRRADGCLAFGTEVPNCTFFVSSLVQTSRRSLFPGGKRSRQLASNPTVAISYVPCFAKENKGQFNLGQLRTPKRREEGDGY